MEKGNGELVVGFMNVVAMGMQIWWWIYRECCGIKEENLPERKNKFCVCCVFHLLILELHGKDMSLREIRTQFKTSKVHQLYFHYVTKT
jgi:hypothetical protein